MGTHQDHLVWLIGRHKLFIKVFIGSKNGGGCNDYGR